MYSDMVALPLIDARTSASGTTAVAHTRTKLIPRKGISDAWADDMADILSAHKLSSVSSELNPPSLQELTAKLPGVPLHLIEAINSALAQEWWLEATALYPGGPRTTKKLKSKNLCVVPKPFGGIT